MHNILIAPNSFKGSLSAMEVADTIMAGLKESRLDFNAALFPIGDGGDHTAHLMTAYLQGEMVGHWVEGAYGNLVEARYGLVKARNMAILEIAETSGFKTITGQEIKPLEATTRGLGQLILHVIEMGIGHIVICLGGTATIDGGIGMLAALGLRFLDGQDAPVEASPVDFDRVKRIDASGLHQLLGHC